jgi:hypothetical protein
MPLCPEYEHERAILLLMERKGELVPYRSFHQIVGKLVGKSAGYLTDFGHFSPGPDLWQDGSNVSKGRKRFAPRMQKDQIVVATFRQGPLLANPKSALLQAGKPSCGLGLGQITIFPFVIFHACLGEERCSVAALS